MKRCSCSLKLSERGSRLLPKLRGLLERHSYEEAVELIERSDWNDDVKVGPNMLPCSDSLGVISRKQFSCVRPRKFFAFVNSGRIICLAWNTTTMRL